MCPNFGLQSVEIQKLNYIKPNFDPYKMDN